MTIWLAPHYSNLAKIEKWFTIIFVTRIYKNGWLLGPIPLEPPLEAPAGTNACLVILRGIGSSWTMINYDHLLYMLINFDKR